MNFSGILWVPDEVDIDDPSDRKLPLKFKHGEPLYYMIKVTVRIYI